MSSITVDPHLEAALACVDKFYARMFRDWPTALTRSTGDCTFSFSGDTRLFITPGYRFRVVDALLTNFHLPQSTLLMLVCAFAGYEPVMAAYRHAVEQHYRFFSYGDAMFLQASPESR